jgi:MinD superfamily P-loop ATPase
MKIVVASGKGGTGKTTLAVNLAYFAAKNSSSNVKLFDCDVEAPNANLFVNASFSDESEVTVPRPLCDENLCTGCGRCVEVCRYNALALVKNKILVFDELCHSCGACWNLCPAKALTEKQARIGKIQISEGNQPFYFGQGVLDIGESLAPVIVKKLKRYCDEDSINIIDASPGTSCPVVSALEETDVVVLVTEPTPFGLSDLKLAVALAAQMKIPAGVVINRSYGDDKIIEDYCLESGVPIVGKIPFERKYAESYSRGGILIDEFPEFQKKMSEIFHAIMKLKNFPVIPISRKSIDLISPPMKKNITATENKTELVIISGKGGTGKTTLSGALSSLLKNTVVADADVDAANLHLILNARPFSKNDFYGGQTCSINQDLCSSCGVCRDVCHFGAVKVDTRGGYVIDEISCEGCGFCEEVCPTKAITSKDSLTGEWFLSQTPYSLMSHAKLGTGKENSGRLVKKVRDNVHQLAQDFDAAGILVDGPPGTGCPVISSITGANIVLIITEPTLSGVHDMKRALELVRHFGIKSRIVINKADLNPAQTHNIRMMAEMFDTSVIEEIPYDKNVNDALMNNKTLVEHGRGPALEAVRNLCEKLELLLSVQKQGA